MFFSYKTLQYVQFYDSSDTFLVYASDHLTRVFFSQNLHVDIKPSVESSESLDQVDRFSFFVVNCFV